MKGTSCKLALTTTSLLHGLSIGYLSPISCLEGTSLSFFGIIERVEFSSPGTILSPHSLILRPSLYVIFTQKNHWRIRWCDYVAAHYIVWSTWSARWLGHGMLHNLGHVIHWNDWHCACRWHVWCLSLSVRLFFHISEGGLCLRWTGYMLIMAFVCGLFESLKMQI